MASMPLWFRRWRSEVCIAAVGSRCCESQQVARGKALAIPGLGDLLWRDAQARFLRTANHLFGGQLLNVQVHGAEHLLPVEDQVSLSCKAE